MDINDSSMFVSLAVSLTLEWQILQALLFLYYKTNIA